MFCRYVLGSNNLTFVGRHAWDLHEICIIIPRDQRDQNGTIRGLFLFLPKCAFGYNMPFENKNSVITSSSFLVF